MPRATLSSQWLLALVIMAFVGFLAWSVALRQALLLLVGLGLGATLAGTRFGFTGAWRIFIENRDPSGIIAQLVLFALLAIICIPLLSAHPTDLRAALGPLSISLIIGAFVFGASMQVAGGCGSGTLFQAGMGFTLNIVVLPFFVIGSFLGSATLEQWLTLGALPSYSLISHLGAAPALIITLAGIAGLAFLVLRKANADAPRWRGKLIWGAVLLTLFATLNLIIAGQPWGIVYGLGLWGAKLATALELFNPANNPFWSQAVNSNILHQSVFLDVTSITNIGILLGALWIALREPYHLQKPRTSKQWIAGIVAGLLLGYSSRLAFGCNIGAMLSGITTGSLHGWIWLAMAFSGSLVGVRIRRWVYR